MEHRRWQAAAKYRHDSGLTSAQLSRDESRLLTASKDNTARLWDVATGELLQICRHGDTVNGAAFIHDDSRILTWCDDEFARIWEITNPLSNLNPAERILELEVRSGTTLLDDATLRTLTFNEWLAKVRSPEFKAIQQTYSKN